MVTTFQHQEPAPKEPAPRESSPRVVLASAVALMVHYFDILEGDAWTEVLSLSGYNPPSWIRIAVIEALYQGRYKVISVQQILDIWRRRGKILAHFNREFEAIVTVPLPDRVQAQLRNLAREHQLEYRQQIEQRQQSQQRQSFLSQEASAPPIPRPMSQPQASFTQLYPERIPAPFPDRSPSSLTTPDPIQDPLPSSLTSSLTREPDAEPVLTEDPSTANSQRVISLGEDSQAEDSQAEDSRETDFPSAASNSPATLNTEPPWNPSLRRSSSQIDQFCPTPDPSGFDRKLLALANQV